MFNIIFAIDWIRTADFMQLEVTDLPTEPQHMPFLLFLCLYFFLSRSSVLPFCFISEFRFQRAVENFNWPKEGRKVRISKMQKIKKQ